MKLKILTILVLCIMPVLSEINNSESDNSATTNFTLIVKDEDDTNRPTSRITEGVQVAIDNHLHKLRNSSSSSDNNNNDNKHSINVIGGTSNGLDVAINNHLQKLVSGSGASLNKTKTKTKKIQNKRKTINKNISTNLNTNENGSSETRRPILKKVDLGKAQPKQQKPKKKQDLMSRILPMMIIPFMLQTAIIPMVLTALKIALLKAAFIGKIAILLGLLNMFRVTTNPGGVYTHNINVDHERPMNKELVKTHYGYNGDEEYGAYINRRKRNVR